MIRHRTASRPARVQTTQAEARNCAHCRTRLRVCPSCQGRYDTGRLCQQCMSGAICPTCQRYWTWA